MAYKNPEDHKRNSREYYWKNRERYLIQMRERLNKNKDKINLEKRERYKHDEQYRNHRRELSKKHGHKHKKKKDAYMKEYYAKNKEKRLQYLHSWQNLNRDELRKKIRDYSHSERGRKADRKKYSRRKRELGYNELCENIIDEEVSWHHIDDMNVVAIPKDLHELYSGNPSNHHRENLMPIVEQLYHDIKIRMVKELSTGYIPVLGSH